MAEQKKDQWATATQDINCAGSPIEIWRGQFAEDVAELDLLLDYGYGEAARERVALFAKYLRNGWPIPRKHFLGFCDQLDRIAAGENPAKVFGPKKSRGRAPSIEKLRRFNAVANRVSNSIMGGQTLENAIAEVAEELDPAKFAESSAAAEREARLAWEVFGKSYRELEKPFGQQGLPNLKPIKRKK